MYFEDKLMLQIYRFSVTLPNFRLIFLCFAYKIGTLKSGGYCEIGKIYAPGLWEPRGMGVQGGEGLLQIVADGAAELEEGDFADLGVIHHLKDTLFGIEEVLLHLAHVEA